MIQNHHDGQFEGERKESARAMAQNGDEQGDKHLIAHMIPISLTMVEEEAALLGNQHIGIDASS